MRSSRQFSRPSSSRRLKKFSELSASKVSNLDFVANQGMSRTEAGEMNSKCISMAEEFFQSLHLWGTLPREHFLLYLDRFGKEALNGKQPPAEEEENLLCRA